jgi:hypothetical protein
MRITTLSRVSIMNIRTTDLDVSAVCVSVRSRSVFPDLLSIDVEVVAPVQRYTSLALAKLGKSCKEHLASLPQFDLVVMVVMLVLAST